jgi:hypothetical protein
VPSLAFSPAPHAAAAAYCRQARRIRARFGDDPAKRQVALGELARAQNRQSAAVADSPLDRFASAGHAGPAQLFSSRVAAALTEGVLRYSARKDLLREAVQIGLGEFEATLLIAAVQHGERRAVRPAACKVAPTSSSSSSLVVLASIGLQTVIATAVWWVVHA